MIDEPAALSRITLGAVVWDDSFSIVFQGRVPDDDRILLLRTFKSDDPSAAESEWLDHDERSHSLAPPGIVNECLGRVRIHHKLYLVYRDDGFRPLGSQHVGNEQATLQLGRDVTRALRLLHESGMSHNRLSSSSVWRHRDGRLRLFDLSGASIGNGRPPVGPPPRFRYLAPEQVSPSSFGRDHRTDFFALGVLMYRGLTGQHPFEAPDRPAHRHRLLTRQPPQPGELDPRVPAWVSGLVMRLLEKSPDQRYQTHYGLTFDLLESMAPLGGRLGKGQSRIGERDQLAVFRLADTFRGRESERTRIVEAAHAASRGPLRVVGICGAPGIGKSGLVAAATEGIRRAGMDIVGGKADQFNLDIHYALFVQAIEARLAQMAASEGQLEELATQMTRVLGVNASLIIDVIPQLAGIVGPLVDAPHVPSSERLNRFNATFESFLKILVDVGGSLCFFFDDVQWADSGSLALLEHLASSRSINGALVLFCFRDVGEGSTRAEESLTRMEASGTLTSLVRLGGLEREHIARLVEETLGSSTDPSLREQLSALINKRTEGNPLFARHLLEHLHAQGLFVFDEENDRWSWDPEEIVQRAITDDVVDLARDKLDRLVPAAKSALIAGACISNPFEPKRISTLIGESPNTTRALLDQAVERGVLTHVGSGYRFIHDELAQAAYSLIESDELATTRLQFGQRLLEQIEEEDGARVPVDVVNNINFGLASVHDPATRMSYAVLNLRAGQAARTESAYRDALSYFQTGVTWAPRTAWDHDHRLLFELYSEAFESEYLNGNTEAANALFEALHAHADDPHDFAEVVYTKILLLTGADRGDEAVDAGVDALRSLGMQITATPSRAQVLTELLKARVRTAFRSVEDVAESEFSNDQTLKATNALLMIIGPAAYFRNTDVMAFTGLRLLNHSIAQAHTTESAFGYVIYGLVLSAVAGRPSDGYRFAQLAMKLADRGGDVILRSKVHMITGAFISFWSQPVETSLQILSDSLAKALEAGDIQYANYSVLGTSSLMLSTGRPLSKVLSFNELHAQLVQRTNDAFSTETHRLWLEATRTLLDDSSSLVDSASEEEARRRFRASGNQTALTYFWVLKTQLHYLDQDYAKAYELGTKAMDHSDSVLAQIVVADLFFYLGLAAAALVKSGEGDKKQCIRVLSVCRRRFRKWAKGCPQNFAQQHELLCAEMESVRGGRALEGYERAIKLSAKNRFLHVEALANELASAHLASEGREPLAEVFLERSWRLYREWNGYRKARRIAEQHPNLRVLDEVASQAEAQSDLAAPPGGPSLPEGSALSIGDALEAMCLETNADWGAVFGLRGDVLEAVAARDETRDSELVRNSAIVRYVLKSGASIVMRDSAEDSRFAQCTYLANHKPRSIFCRVLGDFDAPVGIVYLENQSIPRIFSDDTLGKALSQLAAIEGTLARSSMLDELREKQSDLERTHRTISTLEHHRDQLGKFVPAPVRRLLAEKRETSEMVRREKEVSVMFVDIAGYTRMSERLGKETVGGLVDRYFSSFAEEIWARDGEIVETAGDGFMAVFDSPPHEPQAARTAVTLQARAAELNANRSPELPALVINIGINSGPALVGLSKLGGKTHERWAYTVHGPTTNLAARIADSAKGGQILVSESMASELEDAFPLRDRGATSLKGVSRAVRLFEIEMQAEVATMRSALRGKED